MNRAEGVSTSEPGAIGAGLTRLDNFSEGDVFPSPRLPSRYLGFDETYDRVNPLEGVVPLSARCRNPSG